MDELDPYRDMPAPSKEESQQLPSLDDTERSVDRVGMNGGFREQYYDVPPVRGDNGLGQGGQKMGHRERGPLSAQVFFTCNPLYT